MKTIDRPPSALKIVIPLTALLLLIPLIDLNEVDGTGTRIGKPDLTIWSVQVDPNIIGQGVLEYPDSYDSDNYLDQQTTMDVSDEVPNEGDFVQINLTVFNIGLEEGSADVEFYDGPKGTGTYIGRDRVDVNAFSYDLATTTWDTRGIEGEEHEIFAYLIPDDPDNESNKNNNEGSREILINFYPDAVISGYYIDGTFNAEAVEGDIVTFDGSTSTDTQRDTDAGLVFTWDFGDKNSNTSNPGQRKEVNLTTVQHIFGDSGRYTVDLTITDQNGASRTDTIIFNVTEKVPVANFHPSGTRFLEDERIIFDAGPTLDSDHDLSVMEYKWDLGDGTITSWSLDRTIDHSYPLSGLYTVMLWARDDDHNVGDVQRTLEVINVEPLAIIESAVVNGIIEDITGRDLQVFEDDIIHLTGSPRDTPSDMDGLNYFWKMSDGTTSTGKSIEFTLKEMGRQRVTFFVTDDDQDVSSSDLFIDVRNLEPIANAGKDMILTTSHVTLNANGSTDTPSDLEDLEYEWNLGDGTILEGKVVQHRYDGKGTYDVKLTVEDDDGARSIDWMRVTIENLAPEPSILGPGAVNEDQVFQLDASGSWDIDGQIRSFLWSFPDDTEREGQVIDHVFHSSGDHDIILTIEDDSGATSKLFWDIWVENLEPTANAGEDIEVHSGETFFLDGSGSNDTISDKRNLTYIWMISDNISLNGKTIQTSIDTVGEHVIELEVRDPEGLVSLDRIIVWVLDSSLEGIEIEVGVDPQKCSPGQQIRVHGSVTFEFSGPVGDREIGLTVVNIHIDGKVYRVQPDRTGNFELFISAPEETGDHELRCTVSRLGILEEETFTLAVDNIQNNIGLIGFATSPLGIVSGTTIVLVGGGFALAMSTDIGRWKFFLLMIPLFSRIRRDDVLDNFERGRIYQYILINPGDYFSHIKEMLDLNSGTLTYHLKVLEQREFIKSRTEGNLKRFYPYGMQLDSGPHRDIQTRILELLAMNPNLSQKEIAGALGVHVSTVNYHINMMVGAGLLRSDRRERVQRYEVQYIAHEIPVE